MNRLQEIELRRIVEACWRIANEADMPDTSPRLIIAKTEDKIVLDQCRWQAYCYLLQTQLQRRDFTMKEPKETWQEE